MAPWQMGAAGGGMLGAGLAGMLSKWKNPADQPTQTLDQMQGTLSPYYQPYMDAGKGAMGALQGQYGSLLGDPGQMLNNIGKGYQKSPGFDFALQQALQGAGHAAAAGGMAGSPQHEQQNMQLATNLGNQDYNNWMTNALGMYNQGLAGEQGMMGQGFNSSNEMGQSMGNDLMSKAMLQYAGQQNQNQHEGGIWGSILGGMGSLAGTAAFL